MAAPSSNEREWWPITTVVNWICERDPASSVENIFDALEDRCACDRVRAQGRLHVYPFRRLIRLNPGDVEHFAKAHSRVRDFFQQIRDWEWKDLTIFPLPSIRAGETWELALARELAGRPGPQIGLRSKLLFRLVYSDPHFFRIDVMREWPGLPTTDGQAKPARAQAVQPSAIGSAGNRRGQRLTYMGALEKFMARFSDKLLSRIADDALARQFVDDCEQLKNAGKPVPNLPRDRRNIEKQVAKIRAKRLAKA
jgi:hypothetical protein